MDRRSFLKGAAVALASTAATTEALAVGMKPNGIRISCNPEHAGYRAWCQANGDRCRVRVYLNGKEVKHCSTADETLGMIVKGVETSEGNIAVDRIRGEYLEETLYGDVRVVIEPRATRKA